MKDLLTREEVDLPLYLISFLGPIAGYLGAFGSLCAIADWFTIWWLIFGLFIVFPISAAIGFALFVLIPIDRSPEGKKRASIIAVESIFQWLCYDFCYLSIFNNWIIPTYILGVISVVLMFIETINTFLFNTKKLSFLFIIELLVGIGLTVYLIYTIPENLSNLQTIITTIVAALFGGLFTLLGVAWTIRKGDEDRKKDREQLEKDRKEEERKKHIPYMVSVVYRPDTNNISTMIPSCSLSEQEIKDKCKNYIYYSIIINDFRTKNISPFPIILYGIELDGIKFKFNASTVLEQGKETNIRITGNTMYNRIEPLKSLYIVVQDVLGNEYKIECKCEVELEKYFIENEIDNEKYRAYGYKYSVEQLYIPQLASKEKTNE